jgi:DNA helicase-2/ATP-dependent DNA helicase PcrA
MPATGWGLGTPAGSGASGFKAVPDPGPALHLTVGDDVIHASFGEGVVTAVEPGNVVVVRFRGQDGDRKLMADYAPIQKAS